jgi:hypothetical protein
LSKKKANGFPVGARCSHVKIPRIGYCGTQIKARSCVKIRHMQITIIDYDLRELTAVVSIPARTPEPNTFPFKGRNGQKLRLGYIESAFPWQQFNRTLKTPLYFTYEQIVREFSGEDCEMIVRNLAMQRPEISEPILESII